MPKKKFSSYDYHEILDRCSILELNVETFLYKHPLIKSNKDLKAQVELVMEYLGELYQMVGQVDYDKVDKEFKNEKKARNKYNRG